MIDKERLDVLLFERGLAPSREKARGMIMAGEVMVNGHMLDKPGTKVSVKDEITLKARQRFVSRGGDKLQGALTDFAFDPSGLTCADVGASTGGFTDCLLQHGALRVYAIDVGYGILDFTLRSDPRVVVIERTNARYIETLTEDVSLVVVDASFISLKLLLPAFKRWMCQPADVIALIKPQFEAGREDVGKKGVVRNPEVHKRVLVNTCAAASVEGYSVRALTASPLKGPEGNREFFGWFGWGGEIGLDAGAIALRAEVLTTLSTDDFLSYNHDD